MGVLRERFHQHMRLKGFAERTQENCDNALVGLTREYGVSPDAYSGIFRPLNPGSKRPPNPERNRPPNPE